VLFNTQMRVLVEEKQARLTVKKGHAVEAKTGEIDGARKGEAHVAIADPVIRQGPTTVNRLNNHGLCGEFSRVLCKAPPWAAVAIFDSRCPVGESTQGIPSEFVVFEAVKVSLGPLLMAERPNKPFQSIKRPSNRVIASAMNWN